MAELYEIKDRHGDRYFELMDHLLLAEGTARQRVEGLTARSGMPETLFIHNQLGDLVSTVRSHIVSEVLRQRRTRL